MHAGEPLRVRSCRRIWNEALKPASFTDGTGGASTYWFPKDPKSRPELPNRSPRSPGEAHVKIDRVEIREIRMQLREPFEISSGVSHDRRVLLVALHCGGIVGWGGVCGRRNARLFVRDHRHGLVDSYRPDPPEGIGLRHGFVR